MRLLTAFIIVALIAVAESLFGAQLIVWGLAQFHINAGILGPWLMVSAFMMLSGTTSQVSK